MTRKIEQIPAEEIKKALIDSNIDDPLEALISIGQSTHKLLSKLNQEEYMDRDTISAFSDLSFHFNFYAKLLGY